VFQGNADLDVIMAQPVPQRMQSFQRPGHAHAAQTSSEVETAGAHPIVWAGATQMSFSRRWDLVEVYMTWHERNKPFSGKSIAQIAQQQGTGIMEHVSGHRPG